MLEELFGLKGKIALVTGGSKGLGFMAAMTLAKAGAGVAVCSRNGLEAVEAARQISAETGGYCIGLTADVSSEDAVRNLFSEVDATLGGVDILHCAAGINIRKPLLELTSADWDSVMNVNVKGAFLCAKAVLPSLKDKKWGRIVFYASMLSFVSIAGRAAYSSSKAALLGLTRTLALEAAPSGVCVNALCPGPFITPMNQTLKQDSATQEEFLRKLPIGRWGNPEELRGIMLYLSSPSCSFMNGSSIVVDGGWTAQ